MQREGPGIAAGRGRSGVRIELLGPRGGREVDLADVDGERLEGGDEVRECGVRGGRGGEPPSRRALDQVARSGTSPDDPQRRWVDGGGHSSREADRRAGRRLLEEVAPGAKALRRSRRAHRLLRPEDVRERTQRRLFADPESLMLEFAGGDEGGGGKFESAQDRDIARAKDDIVRELRAFGLRPGAVVADLGAGTGLLEPLLSDAVGPDGQVRAVELSPSFRDILRSRCAHLTNIHIVPDSTTRSPACRGTTPSISRSSSTSITTSEYPKTYLANVRKALKRHAALCVIDFHRDPAKVTSRGSDWVLTHVRADQATFTDEITQAGFVQVKELAMPQLPENYFLVFRKGPSPSPLRARAGPDFFSPPSLPTALS